MYKEDGITIDYDLLKPNQWYKEDNGWNWVYLFYTGQEWVVYDPSSDTVFTTPELENTEDEDHKIIITAFTADSNFMRAVIKLLLS